MASTRAKTSRPLTHNPRHDVRMDGVDFFRSSIHGSSWKALDAGNYCYCVMLRSGRPRLEVDFPAPSVVGLGPGDVVVVSGLAPHVFRPECPILGQRPTPFERRSMIAPACAAEVDLIIGVVPSEAMALGTLTLGPIVIRPKAHPDLSRRVWRAADMLEDEYADGPLIDRALVVRRLAEIIAINVTRRIVADRRTAQTESQTAPENHRIMQAIDAYFATPDKVWSLAELARAAGMSRTRFAEAFKSVTGQTPVRIVSRLRLTAVARRLASEDLSVEAAADEAGYSSAAAFVRAFHREFGETPARWRRRQRTRAALQTVSAAA